MFGRGKLPRKVVIGPRAIWPAIEVLNLSHEPTGAVLERLIAPVRCSENSDKCPGLRQYQSQIIFARSERKLVARSL